MKRLLSASMTVLSFWAIGYPAFAQADAVQAELTKGATYAQAGNLDAAEKAFQKAYDGASAINDQGKLCQAALQLGIIKTSLHKNADAEKCFQTGLQIAKSVMPANSPFSALTMSLLADLYLTENRPSDALPLYEAAIPNLPTAQPSLAAEKTVNLAQCYARLDKMDSAEKTFEKGIALLTSIIGPDNVETVAATVNFASFQFQRGNDEKALELAQQVLSSKVENKGLKSVANNVLAHVYDRQEKFGKAMHIAQGSLNEYKASKSTDLVKEADGWLLIGRIYKDGHKYRDAEVAIDKGLELLKGFPDNTDYSDALREKSDLFIQQGQYKKAETLANQSKSLREKYLGADHTDVAQNLADLGYIYQQENKYNDAETSYKNALRIYKKTRGEAHPDYVATLTKLAELYRQMGKKPEAESTPAVTQSPPDKITHGDKWCLCVGISNFKDTSINLKYSAKDATDFRDFLIAKGNFKPDHVKLLVDESATRQNLIDQLGDGWLANHVKPDDLVMVYISSHGSQALDEANANLNFLVTYDTNKNSLLATGIPMQWLSKIIKDQVKSQNTVIMLDVCHSGSAADWSDDATGSVTIASSGTSGDKGLQRILTSDPHSIVPSAGQVILCSSTKNQQSWESQEYPNSVFTKRLIDALNSSGSGTKLGEAFSVLKTNVEGEVLRDRKQLQTPQINGNAKGSLISPLSDAH